jgi:L-ascorbate metabolism protein UlaG (beta-lactamase superfamily)
MNSRTRNVVTVNAVAVAALVVLAGLERPYFAQTPAGKVEIQWLGQTSIKVTSPGGKVLVIDPWVTTNPKTPDQFKNLDALGRVDLILVSHGHADHSTDAPALALKNNVPVYGPAGLNQVWVTLGVLPAELSVRFGKGGTITPLGPGIRITATHAEHSSEIVWRNPATGKDESHIGGEPVGFIIELENGFKIYHMGDTGLFGDMRFIGEYYRPDLIIVPIGGHFVMSPQDAAYATREWLKPKYALPVHYATFPVLTGTPEEYMKALSGAATKVFPINPGEKIEF